ncbi:MAG: PQQ-binding-like beta-propeller repeat protein [Dehalococcoidia bacterium]|nr:PQQ-binding-like beta-propeller repeat protein [Dehalococcoidia bacterium]
MGPRGWPGAVSEGDTLYVGSMDGGVVALHAVNGTRIWTFKPASEGGGSGFACMGGQQIMAGKLYASPAVSNGTVYIGSFNHKVYAIANGQERWSFDAGSSIYSDVAIHNGTLFFGTSDGKLYALDADTGQRKAGFQEIQVNDKIWASPVVQGDVLYFGSFEGKLYAADAGTGVYIWDKPFEARGSFGGKPLIVDGTIFIGSFDSNIYAVNADTGEQEWVFEDAQNWIWSDVVYSDGVVYAGSLDHNVYAVDAGTGEMVWSAPFDAGSPVKSSPVISEDVLVVAAEQGQVYGLDLSNGSKLWEASLGESKILAPLYAVDGKVYVNSQDNTLYTVDAVSGEPGWSITLGG